MSSVISTFREVSRVFGYQEQVAAAVFPSPDPTTLFTCATISTLKEELLSDIVGKAFVIQPCLRTQNLKRSLDRTFDPEYLSNFTMLGSLCGVQHFDPIYVTDLLGSLLDLDNQVLVRSSNALTHPLFQGLSHLRTEFDSRPPGYYQWQYGQSELSGMGLTFAVRKSETEFRDIGNLVLMYRDGVPHAVEFGFGLETFCSRSTGLDGPYHASEMYSRLSLGTTPSEKRIGDCLMIAFQLFKDGVIPGQGGAASVMRKALRNAFFGAVQETGEVAEKFMLDLATRMTTQARWIDIVQASVRSTHASIDAFRREVEHIRKHASGLRLEAKIQEYRTRFGIPSEFDL